MKNTIEITSTEEAMTLSTSLAFSKFRLALLVVFSAALGYLIAVDTFNWITFICLLVGGFFITAAANGINQIIEKDLDKIMSRTQNRPIPSGKLSVKIAYVLVGIFFTIGFLSLALGTNWLCTLLSVSSLLVYSFVYTPLKQISPIAVFVGAFPGALPPLLGWVAATGVISYESLLLFCIQFFWQFPHFWAIAWNAYDDYKKAGFDLLPLNGGKTKANAAQILLYNFLLIPISILPFVFGQIHLITGILIGLSSVLFMIPAISLYRTTSDKDARKVMFASFFYLPVILILYLINI